MRVRVRVRVRVKVGCKQVRYITLHYINYNIPHVEYDILHTHKALSLINKVVPSFRSF